MDQIRAGMTLKRAQAQLRPWKAMAAFGAGGAPEAVMLALSVHIAAHLN